jgi:hypothetical protein
MTISESERKFKFRAACEPDVFRFMVVVLAREPRAVWHHLQVLDGGPDCTCELTTTLTLSTLQNIGKVGSDLHVIRETIRPVDEYTGLRQRGA